MKQGEQIIQAVRDWVRSRDKKTNEDIDKEFLKKTGDASKVTNVFSNYGSRTLPTSGESLDITIGKIRKWLNDLEAVAISGKYEDLYGIPVEKALDIEIEATNAAEDIPLVDLEGSEVHETYGRIRNAALLYGSGGVSSATKRGTTDFVRIYLLCKKDGDSVTGAGEGYTLVQLGSSGSTARWSLAVTLTTASSYAQKLILKVPKGSWAKVRALNLPWYNWE